MRAIGYDPATAIADLVDNSITAGAKSVCIRFDPGKPRAVAILDDGKGMDAVELETAMRHGSRSPGEIRPADDLGRFGLGLKTASLSQCRRLCVLSKHKGIIRGMVWDLDDVAKSQEWTIGILESDDFDQVPFIDELRLLKTGTLVIWQKLDTLAAGDPGDGSVLGDRMRHVGDHIALVFHRYLTDRKRALKVSINLQPIIALDPFLENDGSLMGGEETIDVEGHRVTLRAFTLPHISRLTRSQIEKAGGESGLRRQQGFYVYRNRRLIVWGTWFRLFRQEELTKLTRIRVDVTNALDHLWCLDIKKSVASPPAILRDRLRGLVPTMVRPSLHAHQYRGRVTHTKGLQHIWRRIEDRDGIRYEVDRDHPVIGALRANSDQGMLSELDNVLMAIAESLPIEALYNDRANDQIGHKQEASDNDALTAQLEDLARQMLGAFSDRREEQERLLAGLGSIEPFALHPTITAQIQSRLSIP